MGKENMNKLDINRRTLLTGLAGSAVLGLTACAGKTVNKSTDSKTSNQSTIEVKNANLVKNFCQDWSLRDVEALIPYLADDIVYQISDDLPIINGIDAFRKQMGAFIGKFESIRWDTLRSHSIGRLVINERIDYFENSEKGKSMKFHISGEFVIKNDKIIIWKDWVMPTASLDDWKY